MAKLPAGCLQSLAAVRVCDLKKLWYFLKGVKKVYWHSPRKNLFWQAVSPYEQALQAIRHLMAGALGTLAETLLHIGSI